MPYALFDRDRRIGASAAPELGVWRAALWPAAFQIFPSPTSRAVRSCPRGSGWTKILSRRWSESPCAIS
jgi:hypothetical protein